GVGPGRRAAGGAVMRPADRLVTASAVATMLGALTMLPITQDRGYLGWSLLVVLLLGLGAAIVRRTAAREIGALASHLVLLPGFLVLLALSLRGPDRGDANVLETLARLTGSAVEHLQGQSAPMDPHPGVQWLMVAAVGVAIDRKSTRLN